MTLVTLIQKVNSTDRDAIVTIDDWHLPTDAKNTGKLDDAGRPVFTMAKDVVKVAVKLPTPNVITPIVTVVSNVVSANVETVDSVNTPSLLNEVEDEAEKLVEKIEHFIHHKHHQK